MTELETRIRASLAGVADSTDVTPPRDLTARPGRTVAPQPRRSRRRVALVATGAVVVLGGAGVGVAAAAGAFDSRHEYRFAISSSGANFSLGGLQQRARKPVTLSGGVIDEHPQRYRAYCETALPFDQQRRATQHPASTDAQAHRICGATADVFGAHYVVATTPKGTSRFPFAVNVPGAVSAVVAHDDGSPSSPLRVRHGYASGVFVGDEADHASIVGYDDAGHVVGRRETPIPRGR